MDPWIIVSAMGTAILGLSGYIVRLHVIIQKQNHRIDELNHEHIQTLKDLISEVERGGLN